MWSPWTFLVLATGLIGLGAIILPFFGARRAWEDEPISELDLLLAKKSRVLRSIKDLDHEREAGLLSSEDWTETREEYLDEAVRLNRDIADLTGVDPAAHGESRGVAEAVR